MIFAMAQVRSDVIYLNIFGIGIIFNEIIYWIPTKFKDCKHIWTAENQYELEQKYCGISKFSNISVDYICTIEIIVNIKFGCPNFFTSQAVSNMPRK